MKSHTTMTIDEFARLDSLERRINTAWDEAALALAEIKDAKLYRRTRDGNGNQTWDQYCQHVHQITPQWANKLIRRARMMKEIKAQSETIVSLSPTAAGQLEGLEPEDQVEIIQDASKEGQQPTAKKVADARRQKEVRTTDKGGPVTKGGRPTVPGPNIHSPTVLVFNANDEAAILQALVEWSPTSDKRGSTIYQISARVPKEQKPDFLQKVYDAVFSEDEMNFWLKW